MQTWFSSKVRYEKNDENGRRTKISESYLVDAISFSEAEARMTKILRPYHSGDLEILLLSRTNITEVLDFDDDGVWFKAKLVYMDINQETEKKQKISLYVLVRASDIKQAYERIENNNFLLVQYEIISIQETKFMDVFPYVSAEEVVEVKHLTVPQDFEMVNRVTGELQGGSADDVEDEV